MCETVNEIKICQSKSTLALSLVHEPSFRLLFLWPHSEESIRLQRCLGSGACFSSERDDTDDEPVEFILVVSVA